MVGELREKESFTSLGGGLLYFALSNREGKTGYYGGKGLIKKKDAKGRTNVSSTRLGKKRSE